MREFSHIAAARVMTNAMNAFVPVSSKGFTMTKGIHRFATAAFAGALCLAASVELSAAQSPPPVRMTPMMAKSLDVGSKHIVSYFLNADGLCQLTLMIADAMADENSEPSTDVLRLRLTVEPGRSALVDNTEGRLLQFGCETAAQAMNATVLDQVAAGHDIR